MNRLRILVPILLLPSWVGAQGPGTSSSKREVQHVLEQALKYQAQADSLYDRGDLKGAETLYRKALGIRERLVPGSLALATIYTSLGVVAQRRGDLEGAERSLRQALRILEKRTPDSLELASAYHGLGGVAHQRGDLDGAEQLLRQALRIEEKCAPGSLGTATTYHNMGVLAHRRGDLDGAERLYRQALQRREKLARGSLEVASAYQSLGDVYQGRGDLTEAERLYRQALRIQEKRAPGSLEVVSAYHGLGIMAQSRGDFDGAERLFRQALRIWEKLAPGSLEVAIAHHRLGSVHRDRGDLVGAERFYRQALQIREKLAPGSLEVASTYESLGDLLSDRGDHDGAERLLRQALQIREKLAPSSLYVASTYHSLGLDLLSRGDLAGAESWAVKAAEILDSQRLQIGSPSSRSLLSESWFSGAPSLLVSVRLYQNRPKDALGALERFRGRGLSETLYERTKLAPAADVPKELLSRQSELDARLQRAYWGAERGKDVEGELKTIRSEQRDLESQMRATSPHYASLKYPQPLDGKAVLAALDDGTLLLDYALLGEEAYLLAATRDGVRSYKLEIDPEDLERRLRKYWSALASEIKPLAPPTPVLKEGKALYDLLVRPAQQELDASKRVLVCPQGWLGFVPLGALVADPGAQPAAGGEDFSKATFLADLRPLHHTVSVTAYAEGRRPAPNTPKYQRNLLAFGSPNYPQAPVRAKPGDGLGRPLSYLKNMVPGLEKLKATSGPDAELLLGKDATVANLLARAPQAKILHVAVHGEALTYDPLGSWLALTPTKGDEGFLRAGDVLAKLRLSSDLVVMCACQTALGRTSRTEGVDGLTRSFLAAGAKSVVSSLWDATESASEALFESFYARLRKGESKDEALRGAQRDVRRDPRWAHPHFWAPFLLHGDWK